MSIKLDNKRDVKTLANEALPLISVTPDIKNTIYNHSEQENSVVSNNRLITLVIISMFYGILSIFALIYLIDFLIFGKINLEIVIHLVTLMFAFTLGFFKYQLTNVLPSVKSIIYKPDSKYAIALNDNLYIKNNHTYARIRFENGYMTDIVVNEAADG